MHVLRITALILFLGPTSTLFGQLGATREEVLQRYGEGKPFDKHETEFEVREYSSRSVGQVANALTAGGVRPVRVPCPFRFGFDDKHVVFSEISGLFQNVVQTDFLSLEAVDRFLAEVSTGHGRDQRRKYRWQLDPIQTESTPELGTVADRNLRKWGPVSGIRVTIVTRVTTNLLSGQVLSSSRNLTTSPLYSYVDKRYQTHLGVKRVVLVRDDGRAYCVFDIWFDRSGAEAGVKTVYVADAENYFARLFNEIDRNMENPPSSPIKWIRNTGTNYMHALSNFASEDQIRELQKVRLLVATICAADNQHVPLSLVNKQIVKLPKELVHQNLIAKIRRITPEAKQRRESLISEMGLQEQE